jgi:hypothetical protein
VSETSASNIAHLRSTSGTFVAPAHSPYERQLVREHAGMLMSRSSALTLGMHGMQWIIRRCTPPDSRCATCTQVLGGLSCSRTDGADATCIDCAMQIGSSEQMEETHA